MGGIYGIASYDISEGNKKAKSALPRLLRKAGCIYTTLSEVIFDYSREPEVMGIMRDHLDTSKGDRVFRAAKFDEREESKVREWVRLATEKFFNEVCDRIKRRLNDIQKELTEGEIGMSDFVEKWAVAVENQKNRIDETMVNLATFRLSDEFVDFRKTVLGHLDVLSEDVMLKVAKSIGRYPDRVEKEKKSKAAEVEA